MRAEEKPVAGIGEDRISKLPDPLLCQILSNLSTKDVVRTSVLSTRWRSLWLHAPDLDLDTHDFPDDDTFSRFVDKFLDTDSDSPLYSFRLRYDVSEHDASRFRSWIDKAVKRKLQGLDVQSFIDDDEAVKMPLSLNMCQTLVCLKLSQVVLTRSEVVSLPCLKIMRLDGVKYVDDAAFETLILSCPVLEDLSMTRIVYDNVKVLRVRSPTLKSFTLLEFDRYKDGKDCGVVVDAPKIEYLTLRDHQSETFTVKGLGSNVELDVNIIFNVDYGEELDPDDLSRRSAIRDFLTSISGIGRLTISWDTIEILYQYSKSERLPQFYNLTHLNARFAHLWWETMPTFLEACPNLKSLVVGFDLFPETEGIQLSSRPRCFVSTLESVDIRMLITGKTTTEMKLVRHFLENAEFLKKLTLCLSRCPRFKEESEILEELRALPGRSGSCEVVIR